MKIRAILVVSVLLMLLNMTNGYCQSPGSEPYTPTKLEWFEVYLNATLRLDDIDTLGYSIDFRSDRKTDTIIMYVSYLPRADRKQMNEIIELTRSHIRIKAALFRWSSWIKFKEELHLIKKSS